MELETLRELRGYRRLHATTTLLLLCVFLIWAYFSLDLAHNAVPAIAVATWALFTLAYHGLLPERIFTWRLLFYGDLADLGFATILVWFSGQESSPFFFSYLLIIMAAALSLGIRPCFALAAVATGLYLVVGTTALGDLITMSPAVLPGAAPAGAPGSAAALPPRTLFDVPTSLALALGRIWASVAALWLTAYVAGFFAQETRRVRESVQEARDKVEGFSRIDWLTGLYNRRHFDYLLAQEVARAGRYNRPLALVIVDSDNLKVVNDSYGHQARDHLIATPANILRAETRLSDTLVRYGGDEFVLLLPDTEPIGAQFLAERLRTAVEAAPVAWQKERIPISVTVGVASLPHDANDGASLVARADAALYVGKRAGRNRTVTASAAAAAAAGPPDSAVLTGPTASAHGLPPPEGTPE
ncbi:MAG TPA: GGDEF domain-containing protein [Chloroflexota bacterium]|jgi:diguanylate cyclase (GGDEF)-like protein